jgi:F-type H+-transporting ATPase subunit delta
MARNFLFVLTDHRRITMLTEVLEAFDLLSDERLGFTRAEISSARELDRGQRDAVSHEFERLTGKKVRMRYAVDGGLLGGLVARIGSTVYDGSVRGQLQALGKRLAAKKINRRCTQMHADKNRNHRRESASIGGFSGF